MTAFDDAVALVYEGDLDALVQLLADQPDLTSMTDAQTTLTLLHHVAANGVDPEEAKVPANAPAVAGVLIAAGADPNARAAAYGGGDASVPLVAIVTSAEVGYADLQTALVDVLVDAGAAVDGPDGSGWPLAAASSFGYLDTARRLIAHGAAADNLLSAAVIGDTERAREHWDSPDRGRPPQVRAWSGPVLQAIDEPSALGTAALGLAAMFGRLDTVSALLDAGADPNVRQHNGTTALHHAAWGGDVGAIQLLLDRGGNPDLHDFTWGLTAVGWAGYRRNAEAMAVLQARSSEPARPPRFH